MFRTRMRRPYKRARRRENFFLKNKINPQNFFRKFFRDSRTHMCKHINSGEKCYRQWRCPFAHQEKELEQINYYNRNKNYKEIECKEGKECKLKNCQFYHNEDEKRFNITMKRLSLQNQINLLNSWSIKKGQLKISRALPFFSYFTGKETQQFIDKIVELRNQENLKKTGAVSGVELNLVQSSSNISNKEKWRLIAALKDCQDIFFKSKEISYVRIGKKRQFTFIINDEQFVDDVCNEIKERKPAELKLIIKSVGNEWKKMCMMLETIQASKESLFKLELDIREMIGPIDLPKLEKALRESILPLNNLKCIKLRLEFGYIEYNGSYEKDTIEIALDLLKDMLKQSSSRLDVSLSMFGLTVAKKGRSFEVKTDPISHYSERLRKQLNRRLSCWMLYCHLIRYFQKLFLKTSNPERITFDFRYFYGLAPKTDNLRNILANKYKKGINGLLQELSEILVKIKNESLLQFSLKFFAFDFKFQSDLKKKVSFYEFKGKCSLPSQNKSVSTFDNFKKFAQLVHSKLNLQYKYDILKGNLFISGELLQEYYQYKNKQQSTKIVKMKKGNANFLEYMMGNYNSLKKIYCSRKDKPQIVALLKEKQMLFPLTFNFDIEQDPYLSTPEKNIIEINNIMSLFQTRLFLVLRAFAKARRLHPTFSFRHEVLFQILKMLGLNYKAINEILNQRKEQNDYLKWILRQNPQFANEQGLFEEADNYIEEEEEKTEDQVEEEVEELRQGQQRIEGWN